MKVLKDSPFFTNRDELIDKFKIFLDIYKNRPFKKNEGGMRLSHCFALYMILKKINPTLIIESGVLRGQGTWFFEQICPDAEIICIDIYPQKRIYTSKKAKYYSKDFNFLDWSNIPHNTLAFFDDHQNEIDRMIYSKWFGIKHIVFEDNPSDKTESDCYSLKRAFSNSGYLTMYRKNILFKEFFERLSSSFKNEIKKLFFVLFPELSKRLFSSPYYHYDLNKLKDVKPNKIDKIIINKNIDTYYEFPSLIDEISNQEKPDETIFSSIEDLLNHCPSDVAKEINNDKEEATHYNFITYVKLK